MRSVTQAVAGTAGGGPLVQGKYVGWHMRVGGSEGEERTMDARFPGHTRHTRLLAGMLSSYLI